MFFLDAIAHAECCSLDPSIVFTFTSLGASGQDGPTNAGGYQNTALEGLVTVERGIQQFTIPCDGDYWIDVWGARGGGEPHPGGAHMRATVSLQKDEVIHIVVGQHGQDYDCGPSENCGGTEHSGGGGGTFVYRNAEDQHPLVVAGGGGGHGGNGGCCPGGIGSENEQTRDGGERDGGHAGEGGRNGEGGQSGTCDPNNHDQDGGGGGGWLSDGGGAGGKGGQSPRSGARGGGGGGDIRVGGFGGGGAGISDGGGAGGGYNGGGGGTGWCGRNSGGQGGGSFVAAGAELLEAEAGVWVDQGQGQHGQATIQLAQ